MKNSLMRWDPFMGLTSWDPFSELRAMQHEMDRLFNRMSGQYSAEATERLSDWMPRVESYVKENNFVFKCELPGVDPKDLEVSFDENVRQLVIKGERKQEKDAKDEDYLYRELSYGVFERRFTLPEGVKTEEVKAKYSNGVLEITVPAPALAKPRKIEIEAPSQIEGETKVKKAA